MTFDELHATASAWLAAQRQAVVVQVGPTRGSVPREAGTRMLVAAHVVVGTVGGGHLELQAIEDARTLLKSGGETFERQVALGPSLGQCCGGVMQLRHQRLSARALADWQAPPSRFTLHLYGAGHVGRAIAALLGGVPCRVRWLDERAAEFPPLPSPPHIHRLCSDELAAEVADAAPGDFHLVLTHSHALDLAITQAILVRGDFGYFGLIGSLTKRAKFEARLRERGVLPERLASMVCPIGLPGISGKEPEVIALSVVAQLLQAAAQ